MEGKLVKGESNYIWALDAGHGSDTPGKRSPVWPDGTQLLEWVYTRKIRDELIEFLELYNISYYIVNPEDYDISLTERTNRINNIRRISDEEVVTISIHGNAAGAESASGYEIFTSEGQTASDLIGDIFYKYADKTKLFRMRRDTSDGDNDKEARFTMLTRTNGPAILTESGFYTNHNECKEMLTCKFVKNVASMHVMAILEVENQ